MHEVVVEKGGIYEYNRVKKLESREKLNNETGNLLCVLVTITCIGVA